MFPGCEVCRLGGGGGGGGVSVITIRQVVATTAGPPSTQPATSRGNCQDTSHLAQSVLMAGPEVDILPRNHYLSPIPKSQRLILPSYSGGTEIAPLKTKQIINPLKWQNFPSKRLFEEIRRTNISSHSQLSGEYTPMGRACKYFLDSGSS